MNARDYALIQLDSRPLPRWPRPILKNAPHDAPADLRDLALAENILAGSIKNLLLLHHLLQHYSGRNLKSIDPLIQKILVIGLYQLRFLDRIPPSAAVDEAVEQARRFRQPKACPFINAMLRKATRDPAPPLPTPDSPRDYATITLSHPLELYTRLEKRLGAQDAVKFCEHNQQEPPTLIRASVPAEQLAAPGVTLLPHADQHLFVVQNAPRSLLAKWANTGQAQVQDATAAAVVPRCPIAPGDILLDRCAGQGTKTIQLLARTGPTGQVAAVDPSPQRCQALKQLKQIRNLNNLHIHQAAWMHESPELDTASFHCILADVPCSNSGVLARRPEARCAQSPSHLASLEALQDKILEDSAPHVKTAGHFVYSTCSIWPEENQHRVAAFLARHPEFQLLQDHATLPAFDSDPTRYRDGGYVAILRRI